MIGAGVGAALHVALFVFVCRWAAELDPDNPRRRRRAERAEQRARQRSAQGGGIPVPLTPATPER